MQATSELRVSPFYHEAKNQIVQPGYFVACSRYFVERWVPRLGGTAVALVLYLRSLGYYNPLTGECRDGVQVSLKQLAAACGCSERTIQRELEKNEALQAFVRVEACYQHGAQGHVQRLENAYRIAMDDPIVPEDAALLQTLIAQREEAARPAPNVRAVTETPGVPGRKQTGTSASRNALQMQGGRGSSAVGVNLSPPSRQFDTTLSTDCRHPGVKLTQQDSILIPIPTDLPETNNNTPAENASTADVVAFLAETGVRINETIIAKISKDVARTLACLPDSEGIVERQATYLPFRKLDKGGTWGGMWRKSIEGDWPAPDAYLRHEREERQKVVRQEVRVQSRQEQQFRQEQEAEIAERVQTAWERLSAAEQEMIRTEAVGRLSPPLRKRYVECVRQGRELPKIMQEALDGFCDTLMRQQCELPLRSEKSPLAPTRFGVTGTVP